MVAGAKIWDGTEWVNSVGSSSWATVSATTGSPITGTYTDAQGVSWNYYKFTSTGSMTFSEPGYVDLLVVGGGGGGEYDSEFGSTGGGGGGGVRWGIHEVEAISYNISVGAGAGAGDRTVGGPSAFGDVLKVGGGRGPEIGGDASGGGIQFDGHGGGGSTGALVRGNVTVSYAGAGQGGTVFGVNNYDGITLNYDGTSREYGRGGTGVDAVANTGGGGRIGDYSGASGVVIARFKGT